MVSGVDRHLVPCLFGAGTTRIFRVATPASAIWAAMPTALNFTVWVFLELSSLSWDAASPIDAGNYPDACLKFPTITLDSFIKELT